MTNFEFLRSDPRFAAFADAAISAEKIISIDPAAAVFNCRRALEFAVKWLYSAESALDMPYNDNLGNLMGNRDFRELVGEDIARRAEYIRKNGNFAAHSSKKISFEQAALCVENLFVFMDFLACCYSDNDEERKFDRSLLNIDTNEETSEISESDFLKLLEENKKLKQQLSARRAERMSKYVPKPLELSEYRTRKLYIDAQLADAGWFEGIDIVDEFTLKSADGRECRADYVLMNDEGQPIAVIEAMSVNSNAETRSDNASVCAGLINEKYGRYPVIFATNGFETVMWDSPEAVGRKISSIYSKRDIERLFELRKTACGFENASADTSVADRYYQKEAADAVIKSFAHGKRRALVSMASGTGKTRTAAALYAALADCGRVRSVLYLSESDVSCAQARKSFEALLSGRSCTFSDTCSDNSVFTADIIFSTYEKIYGLIDEAYDSDGKIFTCGRFDLVICDETDIRTVRKSCDAINFFDALILGLTSAPPEETEPEIFRFFGEDNMRPAYCYELSKALEDGYLSDFLTVGTSLVFSDKSGEYGARGLAAPKALDERIFDNHAIKEALDVIISNGIKTNHGSTLGKTVIFAKNRFHADRIAEVMKMHYPALYAVTAIFDSADGADAAHLLDAFSDPKKEPHIAVSADMLESGVDMPSVLNVAFFKKAADKVKFRNMLGRGARLHPELIDGNDKTRFCVFDFCGNFEAFGVSKNEKTQNSIPLSRALFIMKTHLVYKLSEQNEVRERLSHELSQTVRGLDRSHFAVKQHLRYVELYSDPKSFLALDVREAKRTVSELAGLIPPDSGSREAARFDALMFGLMLARIDKLKSGRETEDLIRRAKELYELRELGEVKKALPVIEKILNCRDGAVGADVAELEKIRLSFRGLTELIPTTKLKYRSGISDIAKLYI